MDRPTRSSAAATSLPPACLPPLASPAVTGFDDLDLAAHTVPPLTSVRMPLKQLGAAAVSLLLDYPTAVTPHSVLLNTEILYRDSTEHKLPSGRHRASQRDQEKE